jgi:hypothetical protein
MPKINCGTCGDPQYLSEVEWCRVRKKYLCFDCHDYCDCHDETKDSQNTGSTSRSDVIEIGGSL